MYNPAHFAETRTDVLHGLMRRHPLATLITSDANGIEASHLPMALDAEEGVLRCHFARANGQWKSVETAPVLVIFQGAEHYISPGWYATTQETGKVVPTYNYLAVHVRGPAKTFEDRETLLAHLRTLTEQNEAPLAEPWKLTDAPAEYIAGLTKAIVGVEIAIQSLEGKWKVSQNRSEADRVGAAQGLRELGSEASITMARLIDSAHRR